MTEETTMTTTTITSSSASYSNARCTLRDMDELEGTILLPDARPVDPNNRQANADTTCVVATALPTTYFQYDDSSQYVSSNSGMNYNAVDPLLVEMDGEANYNNSNVPEAPVIPTYDQQNALRNSARDRHLLVVGEQRGKIDNEQQREEIQRANQKVASIDYFARQQVQEANRLARSTNRKEEAKLLQTAQAAAAAESATTSDKQNTTVSTTQQKNKEPEYFKNGTFGKSYETSEYKVGEYSTTDYQVSEYKSVYE